MENISLRNIKQNLLSIRKKHDPKRSIRINEIQSNNYSYIFLREISMYNDFRQPSRENWKYLYKGSELLESSKIKHAEFLTKEKEARVVVVKLMGDILVSHDDRGLKDAKTEIEHSGNLREQCAVFIHEFERNPDREYNLSLGDVVFFNLAPVGELAQ